MHERNCQLILQFTENERKFIMEVAKATNLPVSELVVLSILALRLPLGKLSKEEFDVGSFIKFLETP